MKDWKTWAEENGWVHIGYYKYKPLLMKLPEWARPLGAGI